MNALVLRRAVGVEESVADVDDGLAVPFHAQALFLGYGCHNGGFQVLFVRIADELFDVFGGKGTRHALLALGDGKLGAIEAFVLLGNCVQVDKQAIAQLAYGNGNATGAEVVAALDKAACLTAAEEALDLALNRCIALLDLCARLLDALNVLRLGRARRTADAVAARAAAQQHDLIARSGLFATHMAGRRGAYHRTNLHALGHIARMVQLVHLARRQANLIAVGRVARGSRGNQLALRQLALKRLGNGNRRVARAGYAHGLVYVAAARKRVADGAAHARCRAAEGLDLGGMVVGFVLEEEQPILLFPVNVNLALNRAGVHLIGLVQALKAAMGAQVLGADGTHVHQAHGLMLALQLCAHVQILLEGQLHRFVVDLHIGELGAEGGMTAMVRPVGVNHAHLGDGGLTADLLEVGLEELDVGLVHGKAALFAELGKALVVELGEALDNLYRLRHGNLHLKRLARLKGSLAGLNWVDDVMLDGGNIGFAQSAFQHVHLCAADRRALALAYQLNAFACRIGALVELAGKELDGEHRLPRRALSGKSSLNLGAAFACHIYLRFAEHDRDALVEQLFGNALHIVAIDKAQPFKRADAQDRLQLMQKLGGLNVETGLFLNINARNHGSYPSVLGWVLTACSPEREALLKAHLKQFSL